METAPVITINLAANDMFPQHNIFLLTYYTSIAMIFFFVSFSPLFFSDVLYRKFFTTCSFWQIPKDN